MNFQVKEFAILSLDIKSVLDQPITLEEVQKAISKLKNGKAVGVDRLFSEIFKEFFAFKYFW